MAYPSSADRVQVQPEPTGALTPAYLSAAIVLSVATVAAAALDVALTDVELPHAAVGLVRAAGVAAWIVYYVALRFNRIEQRVEQRMEGVQFAEGYVQGVSRRTPAGRVRYLDD